MAWLRTGRVIHDIEKGSNLDLLVRGFHGIGNRLVDSLNGIGAGLQAIALAVSTPEDNSTEVREAVEKIRALRKDLQSSIDRNKGDENG